jgi:hypothetical protein
LAAIAVSHRIENQQETAHRATATGADSPGVASEAYVRCGRTLGLVGRPGCRGFAALGGRAQAARGIGESLWYGAAFWTLTGVTISFE